MSTAEKFRQFTSLVYAEQAKAFLNAYWEELQGETENIWTWAHQFIELDIEKGKEGNDLDEFNAHRFLERMGETKTIKQMRDELRAIDMDFNKRMAVLEYLCFHYHKSIEDFVRRPQGDNTAEINEAQRQLEEAQRALQIAQDAVTASDEAARAADIAAKEAQRDAESAAAAAAELKLALDALQREEDANNETTGRLTTRSQDQSLGVVQRNKAANELAQHLSQDPLPLRQAKITTEAATKKAERANLAAIESAKEAHRSSLQAQKSAEEAREKAQEAENMCADAERFLEEVRSRPGGGQGALWWIDRELQEVKKFLPKRRQ